MFEPIFGKSSLGTVVPEADDDWWDLSSPGYQDYEDAMLRHLKMEGEEDGFATFAEGPHNYVTRRLFESPDGTEICPDAVIYIGMTTGAAVACVADAKRRKRIGPAEVKKMIAYKTRLNAEEARIYIPTTCEYSDGVKDEARVGGIMIVELDP